MAGRQRLRQEGAVAAEAVAAEAAQGTEDGTRLETRCVGSQRQTQARHLMNVDPLSLLYQLQCRETHYRQRLSAGVAVGGDGGDRRAQA